MADRPWVQPNEVIDYSDYPEVKSRDVKKIQIDIMRAENYVIKYTNNKFDGINIETGEKEIIPEDVKIAVILLAERYAYNSIELNQKVKSETFDDYSYTAESKEIRIDDLGIPELLDNYQNKSEKNNLVIKLRKL